jgi:hypothetical protein
MTTQMSSQPTNAEGQTTAADHAELQALLINEVLTDYLQMKDGDIEKTIILGDKVLSEWVAAKTELKQTNRVHGSLFNPFQFVGIGETTHSALLGDLLDPQGSHGQGKLFLESFLNLLDVPNPAEGKWIVTVELGRIDILLRRLKPSSVIIVENKSNFAIDRPNQLYRYWEQEIYRHYPKLDYRSDDTKRSFKIVYLPPDSSKKLDEDSLKRPREWADAMPLYKCVPIKPCTLPFQELMKTWLAVPVGMIPAKNVRLTTFLQFYSELWQSL